MCINACEVSNMKIRRNISLDKETNDILAKLAEKSHRNVSQWITDRVWDEMSKSEEVEKNNRRRDVKKNEQA